MTLVFSMKKYLLVIVLILFCFATNAMNRNSCRSLYLRDYFAPIKRHPNDLKRENVEKQLRNLEINLEKCYHGEKEERLNKLERFINDCSQNNVNPNFFCANNKSALKLACQYDKKGQLFMNLVKYKIYDDKNISNLFHTALIYQNFNVLKIMATLGFLSAQNLLQLINMSEFSCERIFLLQCFTKFLQYYKSDHDGVFYIKEFLKIACKIDQGGEEFLYLIKSIKQLEIDFIEEIFQISCKHKNYSTISIMESYFLLDCYQILHFEKLILQSNHED